MTERERFDFQEQRQRVFARDRWTCVNCGEPIMRYGTPQLAHRVAKSRANIGKYGKAAIHHADNLASVCSLRCNSAVLINGEAGRELMRDIQISLDAL